MCVCVWIPVGLTIDDETIEKCWKANDDGAGLMWSDGKKLHLSKGFMELRGFIDAFRHAETQDVATGIALHFRIGTHGAKDHTMTHPFWVREGKTAIIHNGILSCVDVPDNSQHSDTAIFAEKVLSKLPERWFDDHDLVEFVTSAIGYSNKLLCMHADGTMDAIGEWSEHPSDSGIWYSNLLWNRVEYYYKDRFCDRLFEYSKDDKEEFDSTIEYCQFCNSTFSITDEEVDFILKEDCDILCPDCRKRHGIYYRTSLLNR